MTAETADELLRENDDLRRRLEEAECALLALRAGEVDAVLVGADREQVYTLESADKPYQLVVARMHQAAATLTTDGILLHCNRQFSQLLGRPMSELRGTPLREFVAPESRPVFDSLVASAHVPGTQGEVSLVPAGGPPVPVYLGFSQFDEGALGACLLVTDLSERRHYEELQRTQRRLQLISDSVPALISYVDTDLRYQFCNRAYSQWFGMPTEQIVGRTMPEVLGDAAWETLRPHAMAALTGTPVEFETEARYSRGGTRWIHGVYTPDRDADGRVRGLVVMVSNVSASKAAEQALRAADRRKDEFVATLAHELRNPLAPIRNAVRILKARGLPDAQSEWATAVLERQVQLMARLLEDLLDVSRITRNKLELRTERVDLAAVVETAVETSRPVIDAGGHELTVTLPTESVYLEADATRLSQVFANLLNNAAKYTEDGGRVALTAARHDGDVVVSVKDSGIGIAAEVLPRVFDMFSQVTPTLLRSQGGLGIGLSLARGLVELHGGSIAVKSDGLGQGSEFVVRLPLAAAAPVGEPARPGDGPPKAPPACRILIVDDNRDSADSLAMLLRLMGHEVSTAYDGEQAVEVASAFRPDVALLDIGMPKLNGYEACRRIREQPWGRDMILVALTGWGQEEDRRRTRAAGFNQHIVKPVDLNALLPLLSSSSVE